MSVSEVALVPSVIPQEWPRTRGINQHPWRSSAERSRAALLRPPALGGIIARARPSASPTAAIPPDHRYESPHERPDRRSRLAPPLAVGRDARRHLVAGRRPAAAAAGVEAASTAGEGRHDSLLAAPLPP